MHITARTLRRAFPRPMRMRVIGGALALLFLSTGCTLGPGTVPRDRSDYASSISESWKRQTLLNIVKLRYLDPPIFVDVGQIVAGYSVETTATAGGSFPELDALGGKTATVGGGVRYTDRPTITYVPLTGNRFVRSLMTPLPPESVFFTIQSGWPADAVLFTAVSSMNGLKNQESTYAGVTPPDPRFLRVLELMRQLQRSGGVGMRVQTPSDKEKDQRQNMLLTFRTAQSTPEAQAMSRELRDLLKLDQEETNFRLVVGGASSDGKEIAVTTRSILHLMQTMATQVDVPKADVEATRVGPGWQPGENNSAGPRLVAVYSSDSRPRDAFVSVFYRGHWFWIDDRDLKTKRTFAFMMLLFTLADTADKEALPLITIPAQ